MTETTSWKKKAPLWITWSRIVLTLPILILLNPYDLNKNLIAAALFVIASITDYFDGYYARKWNAVSNMGKFMDPIADKILVSGLLIFLLYLGRLDPWMVFIIITRDTFIGGIRSVAAADNIIIAAQSAGKIKTALQMIALPAVMIGDIPEFFPHLQKTGLLILWVSVALSISSGIKYYLGYLEAKRNI